MYWQCLKYSLFFLDRSRGFRRQKKTVFIFYIVPDNQLSATGSSTYSNGLLSCNWGLVGCRRSKSAPDAIISISWPPVALTIYGDIVTEWADRRDHYSGTNSLNGVLTKVSGNEGQCYQRTIEIFLCRHSSNRMTHTRIQIRVFDLMHIAWSSELQTF